MEKIRNRIITVVLLLTAYGSAVFAGESCTAIIEYIEATLLK